MLGQLATALDVARDGDNDDLVRVVGEPQAECLAELEGASMVGTKMLTSEGLKA